MSKCRTPNCTAKTTGYEFCEWCTQAFWRVRQLRTRIPSKFYTARLNSVPPLVAERIMETMNTRTKGIYVSGPPGTGKTYTIAAAIIEYAWKTGFDTYPKWENVPALLEAIRRSYDEPNAVGTDVQRHAGIVILDDLGAEKPTEWTKERLYSILNWRYERDLPVFVTSNLSVDQVAKQVGARIASRLCEMCDLIELQGEDRRKVVTSA